MCPFSAVPQTHRCLMHLQPKKKRLFNNFLFFNQETPKLTMILLNWKNCFRYPASRWDFAAQFFLLKFFILNLATQFYLLSCLLRPDRACFELGKPKEFSCGLKSKRNKVSRNIFIPEVSYSSIWIDVSLLYVTSLGFFLLLTLY